MYAQPVVTWDDYVHVLLMESGDVARAAIYLLQDGYPALAHTQSFVISPEQVISLCVYVSESEREKTY